MTTVLAFVFVLGVLVFVHELGHFLAAKRVGIRVLKFQLGFNPTLVSVRRGDTEYGIGALPLGGYVKMAGESPEEVERDDRGTVVRRPDEFLSKTKWQRFQVLIMGPTMNILLAFVLTAIVLYQGAEVPAYQDQPPVVGVVMTDSPAARAGLRPGDRITSVADHRVDTWEQFLVSIGSRGNRQVPLTVVRGGREITRTVTPEVPPEQSRFEIANIGVLPDVHPHVRSVTPGEPAEKAGLKKGDVVTSLGGKKISNPDELASVINSFKPGDTVKLTYEREGQSHTVQVKLATRPS
jgi:regulator of sigma E protease